jgi:hypothetical protein
MHLECGYRPGMELILALERIYFAGGGSLYILGLTAEKVDCTIHSVQFAANETMVTEGNVYGFVGWVTSSLS